MILVALLIGVILIVAAIRNSQDALFAALGTDVPGFVVWAAAVVAVGAVGFIPGLKPISRGLLALVILVIVLRNYKAILAGFQSGWQSPPAASGGTSSAPAGAATLVPGGGSFGGGGASGSYDPASFLSSILTASDVASAVA